MPYTGEDWRSPGDFWVKTNSGWQKLDALRDNVNRHIRRNNQESSQNDLNEQNAVEAIADTQQPEGNQKGDGPTYLSGPPSRYLLIPRGNAREKGMYFTLGEVMLRLDFASAVHDPRRFNYVCRMLELLVSSHFSCFSGTAQKNLLYVIDGAVGVATETKQHLRRVRHIITTANEQLIQMKYTHVGAPATWKARLDLLEDMLNRLNRVQITERDNDDGLMMTELPDDCIRLIFRRLGDHEDIINTGATNKDMHRLSNEPNLWRQLCFFQFSKEQILREIGVGAEENAVRWKACYQKLYKRYGRKELYADMLHICSHCNSLFWKEGGHPCSLETPLERSQRNIDPDSVTTLPITPQQFMMLFQ